MGRRQLANKRILITGGSSGIGRGLVIEAARRGANVLATARDATRLQETIALARQQQTQATSTHQLFWLAGDITVPEFRQRLCQEVEQQFGGLDLLVNNAGIGATGHFQDAAPERLRQIMEVNFFAPCELTRVAIPLLKAGQEPAIVMIGSVVGRRGMASRTEYSASKFALSGFSEALRAELVRDEIELTLITMGLVDTPFEDHMLENRARLSMHQKRSMSANKAAELIWNAVERRQNEVVFTLQGKMLLWVNRFFPRLVDWRMAKVVRRLWPKTAPQFHSENSSPTAPVTLAHTSK